MRLATPTSREVRSSAELSAPVERVWEVLTDFASFPTWNPVLRSASGPLVPGGRQRISHVLGGRRLTVRPTVTVVDPPRELRWLAAQRVPGLFDVDRRFLLEPLDASHTRLTQSESATGLLAPLLMALMGNSILAGYQAHEAALRSRVTAPQRRTQGVGRS